jgi:hypothetical protein
MARISDRGDTFFNPERATTYFIENFSVAVKRADAWVFFDPATPYLEPGMLRWQEENQQALIADPKEGFFVKTPVSDPERSKRQRKGVFQLREDGTLEGSVEYIYTGHDGRQKKVESGNTALAQQEQAWKESLQARLSTAEISGFAVTNANEKYKPLTVRHNVSIPRYATRTGNHILFQPGFFERNVPPRFPESDRKWDLYFPYGWSEEDEVTIELPSGWTLDHPVVPTDAKFGDAGEYTVQVRKTVDGRKLIYHRHLDFGRKGLVLIPRTQYQNVKRVFSGIEERDAYTIALTAVANAN